MPNAGSSAGGRTGTGDAVTIGLQARTGCLRRAVATNIVAQKRHKSTNSSSGRHKRAVGEFPDAEVLAEFVDLPRIYRKKLAPVTQRQAHSVRLLS
jgi:hypothetical protein